VVIEAREESKAVLPGEGQLRRGRRTRLAEASRLAADRAARLEHFDREAAIDQLVGRRQARDATAEDRHALVHCSSP